MKFYVLICLEQDPPAGYAKSTQKKILLVWLEMAHFRVKALTCRQDQCETCTFQKP